MSWQTEEHRREAYFKTCDRIDDLAQRSRLFDIAFYQGCIHGQNWLSALKDGRPLPKEPRSVYKRLQKHYERQLRKMK